MKNNYKKLIDKIEFKKDFSDDVRQAVYSYERKPSLKYQVLKVALAVSIVFSLISLPSFIESQKSSDSFFTIKADENIYEVKKSEIILKSINLKDFGLAGVGFNPENYVLNCDFALPLSFYVEGDNIESVSYQINSIGRFSRLQEKEELERSENSTGFFRTKESVDLEVLSEQGFDVKGENEKKYFEILKEGTEITIPYEKQKTIDALYGIAINMKDKELVEQLEELYEPLDESSSISSDELNAKIEALMNKGIAKALNQIQLKVRVNYKDKTYEMTNLSFVIDENNYQISVKD